MAFGDNITIQNPSFETPNLSNGGVLGQSGIGPGSWITYAPGWVVSTPYGAGEYYPGTLQFPTGASNGNNVLWVNSAYVYQTVAATVQDSTTYTLSVDVGQRSDDPTISYWIYLMAGNPNSGPILAEDVSSLHPASGTWLTSTLSYTAGPNDPFYGEPLSIVLGSNHPQTDFDNVLLSDAPASVTPEPSSLVLAGTALALACGLMRNSLR